MLIILSISILLGISYAILLIHYRFAWQSVTGYELRVTVAELSTMNAPPVNYQPSTVISVLIPARNESQNIRNCLDSLLKQSYPKRLFEIIVVDDHSEDDTAAIVKNYADANIILIRLKDHVTDRINSYKKKAIEVAVAAAKGTLIVTTDADCYLPPRWLETIAAFYEENKPAFIAAPVSIDSGRRFIEIFQALDIMSLQGMTGAVVSKKQMTMCNGANMAYERAAFYEVNGFTGIDNIASGDDMLLMNKIYKQFPERVMFLKSPEVIVHTKPVHNIIQFFNQRIRWASKADKYEDKRILPVLLLVYLFNCILIILPIIAIFNNKGLQTFNILPAIAGSTFNIFLSLLILKILAEFLFIFPVAKFFRKRSLLWVFPFMQPFHILYTVIAGWLGKFGTYKWKGRNVS